MTAPLPGDALSAAALARSPPAETRAELRSARFRQEREPGWKRLDELVARVERSGPRVLSYDEARELATTYRQAMNSLSVARDISLDRALLAYLESLCARAYLVVYAPQERLGGLFWRLISCGIPQAVRRSSVPLLIGFLALILGAVTGWQLFREDQDWYYFLMPPNLFDLRGPDASTEYLRATLYEGAGSLTDELTAFSAFLFSHNSRIAVLVFAVGVFWAMPSFVLTFYNGMVLGAFFGLFQSRGLGFDVFAWLSIHGVTELAAVAVACAGGARLGLAVLLPGRRSRREALRHVGDDAVKLAVLAVLMLIVAALVEGFLRQTVQAPWARLSIGWGLGLFWLLWLSLAGRDGGRDGKGRSRGRKRGAP